jgi:hypothetical protein
VQRANQIGDPFSGVSHSFSKSGVQWVNPAAFTDAAPGTFGTSPHNGYYGPGFATVDFSVVKNTKVTERIATQLRIEMFNLFNRTNLAPPSNTLGSGFGISADTIGDYNGAPRDRARRSVQLATRVEDYFLTTTTRRPGARCGLFPCRA